MGASRGTETGVDLGFGAFGGQPLYSLGPQRDLSALDLQTWKALAGQTQTRRSGNYLGSIFFLEEYFGAQVTPLVALGGISRG